MKRKDNKKNSDEDLLKLQPSDDYKNPGAPKYNIPHGPRYTSGTYHEKLTGHYSTYKPDRSLTNRPISHGKSLPRDIPSVKVTKGNKVPSAARGVGQETVDGFMNKNAKAVAKTAMKNRKKPPRRR